eukprot:2662122-Rhodomonas_salina.1
MKLWEELLATMGHTSPEETPAPGPWVSSHHLNQSVKKGARPKPGPPHLHVLPCASGCSTLA